MMVDQAPQNNPHRRWNPLVGEWVLVSPHRTQRPWSGQVEKQPPEARLAHDPQCYLCPGNTRAGGERNPDYGYTFVFDNDFPALLPDLPVGRHPEEPLLRAEGVQGVCRVICFSPRHDMTLAELPPEAIERVIDMWRAEGHDLGERYRWVQIFENKGVMMGASNQHPHGQIWALNELPTTAYREDQQQRQYYAENERPLLYDYAVLEARSGDRVVVQNDHWLAVVPFWAVWPYEILLLPRQSRRYLSELGDTEQQALARILKEVLVRYDNLFEVTFPYSMGWHMAPFGETDSPHWQLHAHFYPPLLRSATVRKFMVGFEMLGEAQRDLTPEQAAERLRQLPGTHYSQIP